MRAYVLPPGCQSLGQLTLAERPDPTAAPYHVVVRVRAMSINSRDQAVVAGRYVGGALVRETIPLSDGAGDVVAIGDGVTRFKPGDRVAATFFQTPPAGPPFAPHAALGSPLDGMLAEQVSLYENGLVPIPGHLSYEEAACLPCAGVTAWHALMCAGRPVGPGSTVLVLGTGGVSMFALQLAKSAGARVIVTSSADWKLERVSALGAADTINYTHHEDWDQEVLRVTGNIGVDCVVEVAGAGTLNRSMRALARGGKIGLIGVLTGRSSEVNPYTLMPKGCSLHGIFVGDREMFEQMNRTIAVNNIAPVVDRVFPFEEAAAAYQHHASGKFVGKVVIAV